MRSRRSTLLRLILPHLLVILLILLILLLLFRGIRPKDLVDGAEVLLREGAVAQELRMRLAGVSPGKKEPGKYSQPCQPPPEPGCHA
jgi:hypothetical protein